MRPVTAFHRVRPGARAPGYEAAAAASQLDAPWCGPSGRRTPA